MEKIKLYKFRENCSCCFVDLKEGINVCSCQLSFCDKHMKIHSSKNSCCLLYRVENKDQLKIEDCDLTEEERSQIIERLKLILKCNNYDEKVIFKDNEVECPDILHISVHDKIKIGKLDQIKCRECEVSKHLYICFTCGFIGCGRVQYGIEGNGHAKHHHKITGHSVFVLISSITPEYICDTFCYNCDEFVINPFCESKIECEEFSAPGKSWIDKNDVPEETLYSTKSSFVGIKNAGNTCFISSVFQLIGYIATKENVDFDQHFEICEESNPLNCIYCQTCRIFNEMKIQRSTGDEKVISIVDLLKLLWTKFPMFEKNVQHDANEFLIIFLDLIREAEFIGIFPNITKFFTFQIENMVSCSSCKDKNVSIEDHSVLYTPFQYTLQKCVEEHFKNHITVCKCGGEKIVSNKVLSLPKYLIATIGRCKFENDKFVKITSCLGVDEVNLSEFIKRPPLSNYFIKELQSKGFTEEQVCLALASNVEFDNKEEVINEYKNKNRTNSIYNVQGSIVHTGFSMDAGHYMWFAKDGENFYLVNDRTVTEEAVEYFEQSYIICLE